MIGGSVRCSHIERLLCCRLKLNVVVKHNWFVGIVMPNCSSSGLLKHALRRQRMIKLSRLVIKLVGVPVGSRYIYLRQTDEPSRAVGQNIAGVLLEGKHGILFTVRVVITHGEYIRIARGRLAL